MKTKLEDIDLRYINAEFIMTNGCNLRCDYCFERQRVGPSCKIERMSFEVLSQYMDLIIKNRKLRNIPDQVPSAINFFGGEPMLCWDAILEILEAYKKYPFFEYSIITNGTLVTREILERSKEFPILWQISIDSAVPEGNYYRFKDRSKELTEHCLDIIKGITDFNFSTPIVSSVINDKSVDYIVDTHSYFADRQIPVKWQFMLERTGDNSEFLEKYAEQCEQLVHLLAKNPFNTPMLWRNVLVQIAKLKQGQEIILPQALTESAAPNNIYIVGPNRKLYLSTNDLNIYDEDPMYYNIGGLPDGIDIDKLRNHKKLASLSTSMLKECENCPSLLLNPCCTEQLFFVYPRQFKGNCDTFLSSTVYALDLLKERRENK